MNLLNQLIDSLFTIGCKAITLFCAVAYVCDNVFDINLVKLF